LRVHCEFGSMYKDGGAWNFLPYSSVMLAEKVNREL